MNNFELHELAQELSDTHTPYQLAKKFIEAKGLLEEFHLNQIIRLWVEEEFSDKVSDYLDKEK